MDFRDILRSLGQLSEATEKTKTGLKHTAEPGGYGRKDDEDEEGNKVKQDTAPRGRGRPKKDADASGEVKKYDSTGIGSVFGGGKAPKKPVGTVSKKHSLKEYFDQLDQALLEGETIEKQGGRVHKGTYGTSHEAGDEGVKKVATQRGRGRPKKDADETGEVKKYDFSAFGAKKGVKLPAWDKSKTTKHSMKEAEQIQIKPASQVPPKPGQPAQQGQQQQQQVAGQAQKNTQVIQQGNKTLGTVDNPQLAQQIKQSIGKGEMTLNPDEEMAEGRDEGKPGKNFAKIAKGAAERYGSKAAGERVAGAVRAKLMKQGKIEESVRLSESSDTLEHIINKFKHEVKNFINGDDLDSDLYEALYDYYSDAGEIPYGIAKGRTGDPFEWVTERFDRDVQDHLVDESGPARYEVPAFKRINRDLPAKDVPIGNTKTLPGGIKPPTKTPLGADPFAMEEGDMMDMQFESWDKQLNKLLTEGITVSSSKGQQGAPDSVSVTATDADSDHLLAALRNAGLGIFGDDKQQQGFGSSMTMHSVGGESPMGNGSEPEESPGVVGDGDDMMSLIKKMTGIQDSGNPEGTAEVDYEEEGEEDHSDFDDEEEDEVEEGNAFSGAVAKAKSDNIPDKGQKFNVGGKSYPVKEEDEEESETVEEGEEECNECGYAMEACGCDHEQVEENYANSAEDPEETEMMKLKALLSVGGDMHRLKRSQSVGNPTQVAFESQVNDWKKLSGIK